MDLHRESPAAQSTELLLWTTPIMIAAYFLATSALTVCLRHGASSKHESSTVRRDIIIPLFLVFLATYVVATIVDLVDSLLTGNFDPQGTSVYNLSSILVWGIQLLLLLDAKITTWYPFYGSWVLGVLLEGAILITSNGKHPIAAPSFSRLVESIAQSLRIFLLILILSVYAFYRQKSADCENGDAERQSLLGKSTSPTQTEPTAQENGGTNGHSGYGATAQATAEEDPDDVSDAESEDSYLAEQRKGAEMISKRLASDGNWLAYIKGYSVFVPYIWPINNRRLQFQAVLVGLCLLSSNALNVLIPRQLGLATDALAGENGDAPWVAVSLYILYRFLNSGSCLGWLQQWLWIPLEQYSYEALSTAAHAHIMSLSADFHDNKTSSEINSAVSQGRSVSNMLDTVVFQIVPMLIDLVFAFFYLYFAFGPYMALLTAFTTTSYLYITSKLVARRAKIRREYIALSRKEWIVAYQGLDGWRTATLFNNIPYEKDRYAHAVQERLKSEKDYTISYQAMGAMQGLTMTLGLLGGSYLAIYQVTHGEKSAGSFVALLTYWGQLSGPLAFFSGIYNNVSNDMMDAERLLELFETKPSVYDAASAKPLKLNGGRVKFSNVSFSYDPKKTIIDGVSFDIKPGSKVALVGETGSGKSTILKLLNRYYDVTEGSIEIDEQDIRDVALSSLRDKIGVVPQDPALLNESVMNNIRYAKLTATEEEVYQACRAAAIHDKILSFPQGYSSKVGEHGVKLSGGEQQRVAIARAILKQPDIILLDEATSAVDTETEELIQKAFEALCANRTTFIVAHRLSTIMRADLIMVVKEGQIIETGTHDELIRAKGKYRDLWSKQIFAKPSQARSRSNSPSNDQLGLINDLTVDESKAEVAKAIDSTTEQERETSQNESPASGTLVSFGDDNEAQETGSVSQEQPTADNSRKRPGRGRSNLRRRASRSPRVTNRAESAEHADPKAGGQNVSATPDTGDAKNRNRGGRSRSRKNRQSHHQRSHAKVDGDGPVNPSHADLQTPPTSSKSYDGTREATLPAEQSPAPSDAGKPRQN